MYLLQGPDKIVCNFLFIQMWCALFYYVGYYVLFNLYTQLFIYAYLWTNICIYVHESKTRNLEVQRPPTRDQSLASFRKHIYIHAAL